MMNKNLIRFFALFIAIAVLIGMLLLVFNTMGFLFMVSDESNMNKVSPKKALQDISRELIWTEAGFALENKSLLPEDAWCMLIDENGDIIWEEKKPQDIPDHYSINDIAVMTRWYLNDYPVYVRTEDYGLLVLGYPKNAVGKYDMEYSMTWFERLPLKIFGVLALNLCLAILLAWILGSTMYRSLKTLTLGIHCLDKEKPVRLKEKGMFRELAKNINDTSVAIEHKNIMLAQRERAREEWVAGISHDIRTPLSIILGYAEELTATSETQEKAQIIAGQTLKIKKLVEDLNVISSLEYDMQPSKKRPIKICGLLRRVVSEILNSGIADIYTIELDLNCEKAVVLGDENLLERAFFNIIHNSIIHNKEGCHIRISAEFTREQDTVSILISDTGTGVKGEVLDRIKEIPKTARGLGLPLAYKIITAHGGDFSAYNQGGFCVRMELRVQ